MHPICGSLDYVIEAKNDLRQSLALLNGPEHTLMPAYCVDTIKTITFTDHIAASDACRIAGETSSCGRLKLKFTTALR